MQKKAKYLVVGDYIQDNQNNWCKINHVGKGMVRNCVLVECSSGLWGNLHNNELVEVRDNK